MTSWSRFVFSNYLIAYSSSWRVPKMSIQSSVIWSLREPTQGSQSTAMLTSAGWNEGQPWATSHPLGPSLPCTFCHMPNALSLDTMAVTFDGRVSSRDTSHIAQVRSKRIQWCACSPHRWHSEPCVDDQPSRIKSEPCASLWPLSSSENTLCLAEHDGLSKATVQRTHSLGAQFAKASRIEDNVATCGFSWGHSATYPRSSGFGSHN